MDKKCKCCGEFKLLSEFYKVKKNKDGLDSMCISCVKGKQAKYRLKNKDKLKFKRDSKSEYFREKSLSYYYDNRESRLLYMKDYRDNNKDKIKIIKKDYREKSSTKEMEVEYSRKYFLENREKILEKNRNWNKKNAHIVSWRSILKSHLRRIGKSKEGHTIDLLGYSALELKEHIEKQFTEGMSWDNHGEWHIDHIKPVTSFDVNTPPNVVNALSNLRPLWATTREIKGIIYKGNLNKYNNEK